MKEPLLPAVVANEPEPSVPHESLDRTARHPSPAPWARTCPQGSISKFIPAVILTNLARSKGSAWKHSEHVYERGIRLNPTDDPDLELGAHKTLIPNPCSPNRCSPNPY